MIRRPGQRRRGTAARLGIAAAALACAAGCGGRDTMPPGIYAARHGILVAGRNDAPVRAATGGRDLTGMAVPAGTWFTFPFEAGAEIATVGETFHAPATPTAVCLATIAPGSTRDGASPSIAFTPDGAAIAVAGPKQRIAFYDLPGANRRWLRRLRGRPRAVAISPNGAVAVAVDRAGIEIRTLAPDSGRLVWSAALPSDRPSDEITLSPTSADGLVVARPGDGGDVSVLGIDSGALRWSVPALPRPGYSVRAVGVGPGRERVVLVVHPAGVDPVLELRHADSGELLAETVVPAADLPGSSRVDAMLGGDGRNVFLRTAAGWTRYPVRSNGRGFDVPDPVTHRIADPDGPVPVAAGKWTVTVGVDGDVAADEGDGVLRALDRNGAIASTWRLPAGARVEAITSVTASDGGATVAVALAPSDPDGPTPIAPQILVIEPGHAPMSALRPTTAWTLADPGPTHTVCAPDGRFVAVVEAPSRGRTVVRILD